MIITIYFKPGAPILQIKYRLHLKEFRRLSIDFQTYLQRGMPKDGLYTVYNTKADTLISKENIASESTRTVYFRFEEISIIG